MEKRRYSIVLNGNFAKFLQNEKLMKFLMQTKNKVLVEASPYDNIWGIGMSAENEK
ncbi:NADAR domain-containing protein [Abyssisolibacter fermentans]|uniref:NADAR domain-containing protein n=1 Tax=Abyssisolibacter fermentans TaxID=1766203 RepID=UPI000A8E024F|nr:NADAR domain-containing protein [Abyssisolibacter fermentans]